MKQIVVVIMFWGHRSKDPFFYLQVLNGSSPVKFNFSNYYELFSIVFSSFCCDRLHDEMHEVYELVRPQAGSEHQERGPVGEIQEDTGWC